MVSLQREDLCSLEHYSSIRDNFRKKVMTHKKTRRVRIGDHVTLLFEDLLTMQYQIQEMLRIERIFEAEAIQEELDAYNPLIPDGKNWKATLLIEYEDVAERQRALAKLIGIEGRIWMQVADCDKVWAIADEDLERDTDDKTSSVHFLRFELNDDMVTQAKAGARISIGIEHEQYHHAVDMLPDGIRESLINDLE